METIGRRIKKRRRPMLVDTSGGISMERMKQPPWTSAVVMGRRSARIHTAHTHTAHSARWGEDIQAYTQHLHTQQQQWMKEGETFRQSTQAQQRIYSLPIYVCCGCVQELKGWSGTSKQSSSQLREAEFQLLLESSMVALLSAVVPLRLAQLGVSTHTHTQKGGQERSESV